MPLNKNNNLQRVVDDIREELKQDFRGFYRLYGDNIPHPIWLEVVPDGIDCLVRVSIGNGEVVESTHRREEFLNDLYVLVVQWLRKATEGPSTPATN